MGEGGAGPGPAGPQGDIPYTVISVREPLANLREETHRLLMEQQQQHGTVHNGVMGSNHNSSQVSDVYKFKSTGMHILLREFLPSLN